MKKDELYSAENNGLLAGEAGICLICKYAFQTKGPFFTNENFQYHIICDRCREKHNIDPLKTGEFDMRIRD